MQELYQTAFVEMKENLPIKIELPDSFFNEEERCGHVVSSLMKKVWAVELDLLSEFARCCEKHHLKWFADGGTMLGAARHQGFIPWDDDVDIAMLREDYDKFCAIACQEFSQPYFFSTELTDPGAIHGFARLRNSSTTAIMTPHLEKRFSFNQGIFIDIFPLDNVPEDNVSRKDLLQRFQSNKQMCGTISGCTFMYRPHKHEGMVSYVKHWLKHVCYSCVRMDRKYTASVERMYADMRQYQNVKTPYVAELMWLKDGSHRLLKKEWYDGVEWLPFEMLKVPMPMAYKELLGHIYGDWHKFVKGGSIHGEMLFDPLKPYTEYIK